MTATPPQVQRYVAEQLSQHSRSTAMNRMLACRSWFRYLMEVERRDDDPTANIPIRRDKSAPRRPFSNLELTAMLKAVLSKRDRALLLMLVSSGCRRSEIVGMRTQDIDWQSLRILIRGKGARNRWVAPGQTAMHELMHYLEMRKGQVWLSRTGRPLTAARLYDAVARIALRAGVVDAHPHRFRVTFAVHFLRAYGNIEALKTLLGHEDLKTTETYATYGYTAQALALQQSLDLAGRCA